MKEPLIVLTGPTASGKTELSVELAKKIGGEIISADSIQVYKYMNVGSAKVSYDEMQGIPHYLIDELYPDEEFNICIFKNMAKNYAKTIRSHGNIPIVAGGTGFYIQSLLYDVTFDEEGNNTSIRSELEEECKKHGSLHMHEILKEVDLESANNIHANNVKRVIRAIEFYRINGYPISKHNETESKKTSPYDFRYYVLNMDRNILYDRINKRVDLMIEQGLVEEVENLLKMGDSKDLVSMQGIGYKEIIQHLLGNNTLQEAVDNIKLNTRHFAKRQLTWFRREKEVTWIDYEKFDFDKERVLNFIMGNLGEIIS